MSDFESNVEKHKEKAMLSFRKWTKDQAATEIMRDYVGQEGKDGKSKLDNLLNRMEDIALKSIDDEVSRKAIKDILEMAAGNPKISVQNNNQYNFGDFLKGLKDD